MGCGVVERHLSTAKSTKKMIENYNVQQHCNT